MTFSGATALEWAGGCCWVLVIGEVLLVHILLLAIALSLSTNSKRWSIVSHIIVVLLIRLTGWWGIVWLLRVFIVCLILEIHWVMCLIIQKSFAFKEVLATIESWLLLHLLKSILIWCSIVFIILVLIFEIWYIVLRIHICSLLYIILTIRGIVLVIIITMSLISRRTSVALRNSINISTKEVTTLGACAGSCSWSTRWTWELLVVFLQRLIWILILNVVSD